MDPLEAAKCPKCQETYSRSGLHFCQKGDNLFTPPSKYEGRTRLTFRPLVMNVGKGSNGYDFETSVRIATDEEVIDVIQSTALVHWQDEEVNPLAGRYDPAIGATHQNKVTRRQEPRPVAIAVVAMTRDVVIAQLTQSNKDCAASISTLEHQAGKLREDIKTMKEKLDKTESALATSFSLEKRSSAAHGAEQRAREEAERIVRDLRAELDNIKRALGTERFDELRKP